MGAPKGLGDGCRLTAWTAKAVEAGEPNEGVSAGAGAPKGLGFAKGLLDGVVVLKTEGAGAPKGDGDALGGAMAAGAPKGLAVPSDGAPKGLLAGAAILESQHRWRWSQDGSGSWVRFAKLCLSMASGSGRVGRCDGPQVKVEIYQKDNELNEAVAMTWPGNRRLKGSWRCVASGDAWGKCRC